MDLSDPVAHIEQLAAFREEAKWLLAQREPVDETYIRYRGLSLYDRYELRRAILLKTLPYAVGVSTWTRPEDTADFFIGLFHQDLAALQADIERVLDALLELRVAAPAPTGTRRVSARSGEGARGEARERAGS